MEREGKGRPEGRKDRTPGHLGRRATGKMTSEEEAVGRDSREKERQEGNPIEEQDNKATSGKEYVADRPGATKETANKKNRRGTEEEEQRSDKTRGQGLWATPWEGHKEGDTGALEKEG